jgi:nuclear transport factor 2 (NTF2) superfamily protein
MIDNCAYQSITNYTGHCQQGKGKDIHREFRSRKFHLELQARILRVLFNEVVKLVLLDLRFVKNKIALDYREKFSDTKGSYQQ